MRTSAKPAPAAVMLQAQALGQRIRAARTRRKLRIEDMALHADLAVKTISAIERGELGTGLGAVLKVLWALGLGSGIDQVADPGLDQTGLALDLNAQGQRVRIKKATDNDF